MFFENNKLIELSAFGDRKNSFNNAGTIFAVANLWNDNGILAQENIVFVFTGTDNASIQNAVDVVLSNPEKLQDAFSLIVSNNQILRVPQ